MSTNGTTLGLLTPEQKRGYLAALEAAYYRGVEYVSYAGDQIKYVGRDEMRRAIDELRAELGLPGRQRFRPRPRRIVMRVR